ncbi:hypothetical protein NQ314_011381, partial [Rhamnusium bicolor]
KPKPMEIDMENYMEYKLSNVRARMKPDVPHKFACQPDQNLLLTNPRLLSEIRARRKEILDYLHQPQGPSAAEQVQEELLEPSTSTVVHQICEKACQTKLIHFRSKYVQANLKSEKKDTAISPIKFQISPRQSIKPPRKRLRLENEKAEFTEFSGATTTETSDSDFFSIWRK